MTYSLAVIGCGVIGKRLSRAFQENSQVILDYAVDIDQKILDDYCSQFNAEGYRDYREILEKDIDIIYIGTPPKFHHKIAIDSINAGKHVICEKPISINAEFGQEMTNSSKNNDIVTAINFVFKYSTPFKTMKSMIQDNKIGEIEKIEIRIRMPQWPRSWQDVDWLKNHDQGGPLREIGSHFIYAVQEIFGNIEVTEANVDFTDKGKFEREIQSSFIVRGISGKIDLKTLNDEKEENTLLIYGKKGTMRFRDWRVLEKLENGIWTIVDDTTDNTSYKLINEFIKEIEQGTGKLVSFQEATNVQLIIDKIFEL